MEAYARPYYTLEEYLQLEADTGRKHEYHRGKVYAMSGGYHRACRYQWQRVRVATVRVAKAGKERQSP